MNEQKPSGQLQPLHRGSNDEDSDVVVLLIRWKKEKTGGLVIGPLTQVAPDLFSILERDDRDVVDARRGRGRGGDDSIRTVWPA